MNNISFSAKNIEVNSSNTYGSSSSIEAEATDITFYDISDVLKIIPDDDIEEYTIDYLGLIEKKGRKMMFGLGKIIAAPIRLINAPMRAVEKLLTDDEPEDRFISKPLESIAESVEEAIDGEDKKD